MDSNYNNNQNGGYNNDGNGINNNTDGSYSNGYNNPNGNFNNNSYPNGNNNGNYNNGNGSYNYGNGGNQNNMGGINNGYNNNGYNNGYNGGFYNGMPPQDNRGSATVALVLGILSLIAWCLPFIGYPVTIAGLIVGIGAMKNCTVSKGMATAGVIMCSIGLVATVINSVAGVILNLSLL